MTHILAIDQGTTGTTIVVYDEKYSVLSKSYKEHKQIYPEPGYIEHDPEEIWNNVVELVQEVTKDHKITTVGITNQRETIVIWDKKTGKPLHNAIVWQDRRTKDICAELRKDENISTIISEKTGLPIDPYFSSTKIQWLLKKLEISEEKDVCIGTIDTFLIWKLTQGNTYATDHTNASRTQVYNINTMQWDQELCNIFNIPIEILSEIKKSSDDFGTIQSKELPLLQRVPIQGVAGDQQAALYGQRCFNPGTVKNTYGTGCFVVMNTGNEIVRSQKGLLTTIACTEQGTPCYALEGSVFMGGAVIQWLRDELKILENAADSESAAQSVENTGGVYIVPAFTGLGAPYWEPSARGTIVGLTRGSNREQIIRAALESIAFQSYEVIKLMESESKQDIENLSVDGGATSNNFLMQFQADLLQTLILRPENIETTALGAAMLAGKAQGLTLPEKKNYETFTPSKDRSSEIVEWEKAVKTCLYHSIKETQK